MVCVKRRNDMARYINIWKEKNLVERKAYKDEHGHGICEHECMVAVEDECGGIIMLPVLNENYLMQMSADEFVKECYENEVVFLMHDDCYARNHIIRENITEWIYNECCCSAGTIVDGICEVVSLLTKYGMWKSEYSKCIDMKKLKEELGDEE